MQHLFFTHSYFLRLDPKQWATGQPYAPLGTLYAAAYMRQQGHRISFFDTMFAHSPAEIIAPLKRVQPNLLVIYDDGFNYLTKMCLENMRNAAFDLIRYGKEQGCTVIVSSSDATDHYSDYLRQGADFILLGEAEATLLELTTAIDTGNTHYTEIQGIAFSDGKEIVTTRRRTVLKDLDALPFPAWDTIDIEPYRNMWMKHAGYFSMNMATTRGCPFKCNWCAKPIYGNRYHSRSPANVVAELRYLQDTFGVKHIWFCDDIFGLKPGWIAAFADLISREKITIRFKMQGRVDLLLHDDTIADLARSGCEKIWMGAESGSQRILDAMDKGTTVEEIYKATQLLKRHGIKPCFFIQFGYLSETKDDIDKTISMIHDLLPYEIGISVSYPLPGTVFYEKVKADLSAKANWKDSDDLAMMFRNTYQPDFYRQLHRYVHKSYRMHMAIDNFRRLMNDPLRASLAIAKKAASALYYLPAAFFEKQKLQRLEKTIS